MVPYFRKRNKGKDHILWREIQVYIKDLLSKTRHLPCLKIGGPPSKPKYILLTDSVQVL